jgi:hypothetical protein
VGGMKLRYGPPTDLDDDFAGIVGRTKDLHTITRSTVPLLAWWRDNAQGKLLAGVDLSNAVARFEYAVPARCTACGGRGKASMTDVMLQFENHAVAVEGKYTEPKYETVDSWRRRGKDRENREAVLRHWCHLIEKFTSASVDQSELGSVVYQTLHRAASACAAVPEAGVAHVVYLVFGRADVGNAYADDLRDAARVIDPGRRIHFSVVCVPTHEGGDFDDVARLVRAANTDEERVELMVDALISRRDIYRFEDPARISIR